MGEERLQKILARAGIASRRAAEALILGGQVQVNGKVVTELGTRADPEGDEIRVDGKAISTPEQHRYLVLYKPERVVTTLSDPEGRESVGKYVRALKERVFPVGRLDYDAEGALLLTSDGALAHKLTHPRWGVRRTYLAKVRGEPGDEALQRLLRGVRLDDGMAKVLEATFERRTEKNSWIRLVVAEGRHHLVKRLCEAVDHPVVRLFRSDYGGIGVDGMRPGEIRDLTPGEIRLLRHTVEKEAPLPAGGLPRRRRDRSFTTRDRARSAANAAPQRGRAAFAARNLGGRPGAQDDAGEAQRPGRAPSFAKQRPERGPATAARSRPAEPSASTFAQQRPERGPAARSRPAEPSWATFTAAEPEERAETREPPRPVMPAGKGGPASPRGVFPGGGKRSRPKPAQESREGGRGAGGSRGESPGAGRKQAGRGALADRRPAARGAQPEGGRGGAAGRPGARGAEEASERPARPFRGDRRDSAVKPRADRRPGAGSRPGAGGRPGADRRPGAGGRPGADRRPGAGSRPGADRRPGAGGRPGADRGPEDAFERPARKPFGSDRGPGAGGRPGGRPGGSGPGGRPSAPRRPGGKPGGGTAPRRPGPPRR